MQIAPEMRHDRTERSKRNVKHSVTVLPPPNCSMRLPASLYRASDTQRPDPMPASKNCASSREDAHTKRALESRVLTYENMRP